MTMRIALGLAALTLAGAKTPYYMYAPTPKPTSVPSAAPNPMPTCAPGVT